MMQTPNILIAEDDPDTSEALAIYLKRHGYDVTTASNGWEALLALDSRRVDLMVVDLMMPGMDGETLLKIVHADRRRKDMPAIVLTARDIEDSDERARRLGVSAWFTKAKYSGKDLLDAIATTLQGGGGPDHASN
jgi:DNA-binding response OmpR family regulator